MRRAMQDMDLLTVEVPVESGPNESDGAVIEKVVGINLGWDHAAEHEWGIEQLKRKLGIPGNSKPENFGLKARQVTVFEEANFWYHVGKKWSILMFHGHSWQKNEEFKEKDVLSWIGGGYYDWDRTPLVTAWSEGQFGIAIPSNNSAGVEFLGRLYEAFKRRDVAVWLGGSSNPFANSGLLLCISSELPPDLDGNMRQADAERYQLLKDFEATGIEKRLKDAGKGYYALSPRRQKDGSLIFWLNPMDQDKVNFGWFTVEDLDNWIAGTGKIPMTAEKMAERRRRR